MAAVQELDYRLSNADRHTIEVARPQYAILEQTFLTPDLQKVTTRTYQDPQMAELYSQLEWDPAMIEHLREILTDPILKEIVAKLGPDAILLFLGCGSFRDLLSAAVLSQDVNTIAFDISKALIELGNQRMNLETFLMLVQMLGEEAQNQKSWIGGLIARIKESVTFLTREYTKSLHVGNMPTEDLLALLQREEIRGTVTDAINNINRRVHRVAGDMRNLEQTAGLPPTVDAIAAVGSLPHIAKYELSSVLLSAVDLLAKDGIMYADFRLDPEWQTRDQGRVFTDTVLAVDPNSPDPEHGRRYYELMTAQDFLRLLNALVVGPAGFVEELEALKKYVIRTGRGPEMLRIEFLPSNTHIDPNKPLFQKMLITKLF